MIRAGNKQPEQPSRRRQASTTTTRDRLGRSEPGRLVAAAETQLPGCWVDVYEGPVFGGRGRRIAGPATLDHPLDFGLTPRSLIVGPEALVFVGQQPNRKRLRPGTVLPDVKNLRGPLKLSLFQITRSG
jgi:hypothetical protein